MADPVSDRRHCLPVLATRPPLPAQTAAANEALGHRQWPEVHDLCHTFMHVARNACDFRMAVCFFTRSTCKNVRQNLIPQATA